MMGPLTTTISVPRLAEKIIKWLQLKQFGVERCLHASKSAQKQIEQIDKIKHRA
jgi:hypothetical protein